MTKEDIFIYLDQYGFDDISAVELAAEVSFENISYADLNEAIDIYCASNGICTDDRNSFISVVLDCIEQRY